MVTEAREGAYLAQLPPQELGPLGSLQLAHTPCGKGALTPVVNGPQSPSFPLKSRQ